MPAHLDHGKLNASHESSRLIGLAATLLALTATAMAEDVPRARVTALRVADATITVDGRDDDWRRLGDALVRCRVESRTKELLLPCDEEFSAWAGPEDNSLEAYVATDSDHLYVIADVHDQLLINDATEKDPFNGDDFEVFIDASPVETRFTTVQSPDYRQLIFLPAHLNTRHPRPLVWQADRAPGIAVASRLRPWGYTIEIGIPHALFPNWAAHPELDSIGFDLAVNDSDTPGVDCHHPSVKSSRLGLSRGRHYQSPKQLAVAELPAKPVTPVAATPPTTTTEPEAQKVLDSIDAAKAADIAARAIRSNDLQVRRAGAYLLRQRLSLGAPTRELVELLTRTQDIDPAECAYALIALGERGELPVPAATAYLDVPVPLLKRFASIWALGLNKDTAGVAPLVKLMKQDSNSRIRMASALALGMLGDAAAIPGLQQVETSDANPYVKQQAKLAREQIEGQNR